MWNRLFLTVACFVCLFFLFVPLTRVPRRHQFFSRWWNLHRCCDQLSRLRNVWSTQQSFLNICPLYLVLTFFVFSFFFFDSSHGWPQYFPPWIGTRPGRGFLEEAQAAGGARVPGRPCMVNTVFFFMHPLYLHVGIAWGLHFKPSRMYLLFFQDSSPSYPPSPPPSLFVCFLPSYMYIMFTRDALPCAVPPL